MLTRCTYDIRLLLLRNSAVVNILTYYYGYLAYCIFSTLQFSNQILVLTILLSDQVMESKRLIKCFLNYLRHDCTEVGALFDMLSIFLYRSRIDYSFLKEFYVIEVTPFLVSNLWKLFFVFLSAFCFLSHLHVSFRLQKVMLQNWRKLFWATFWIYSN
jgi:hypothetical protein